ncbi:MAG: thermonuclease family protein [Dolichospermum sp.]|jgi:micrococcal nuclease
MTLRKITSILGFFVLGTGFFVLVKNYSPVSSNVSLHSISAMPISEQWQVLSIHDGDTVKVQKDGVVERIRFCGIDAPEISQPLGKESRDYLRSLISLNKPVQISIVGTDRYNRKIGEIFVIADGTEKFINEEMTKSGMAYSYDRYKNCPNQIAMGNGEAIAKSKKIGVWSGSYEKPWDYRKSKKNK